MLLPPLVLVAMVLLAGTLELTGRYGAVALALASVEWLRVNQPFEGKILWVVTATHGLTAGDLVGLAGIVVAAWGWSGRAVVPADVAADSVGRRLPAT